MKTGGSFPSRPVASNRVIPDMQKKHLQYLVHIFRRVSPCIAELFDDMPHPDAVPPIFSVQGKVNAFRDDHDTKGCEDAEQEKGSEEHGDDARGVHASPPPASALPSSSSQAGQPVRSRQ